MKKIFIDPAELLQRSFELAIQIIQSDFKPSYIIGVWRGGAPVGIAVQELFEYCAIPTDHIAIRTSSYEGIGQQSSTVRVFGLRHLAENIEAEQRLLIVDDVFDSGRSVDAIIAELRRVCRRNTPNDIRVATPYYKPLRNKTDRVPDFFVVETDDWLVFPHELQGLAFDELIADKPPAVQALFREHEEILNPPLHSEDQIRKQGG